MAQTPPFTGLTMPVFAAFGWAGGEEQAIKFALEQLEIFAAQLHLEIPRELQTILPVHGLDVKNQGSYLAAAEDIESDAHIFFNAKPMNLALTIIQLDKKKLSKTYKNGLIDVNNTLRLIHLLGPDWQMRLQQLEIMDNAGNEVAHYQDLYTGDAADLTPELIKEHFERAAYLNGEAQWKTALSFTHRIGSEQVSFMRQEVVKVIAQLLEGATPLIRLLTDNLKRPIPKKKAASAEPRDQAAKETSARDLIKAARLEELVYVSELKPISLKKGFIVLKAEHWPFFAKRARASTRDVLLLFGRNQKETGQVWRLVSNDQTRVVLERDAQHWLMETFGANERIEVTAIKDELGEITLTLKPVA